MQAADFVDEFMTVVKADLERAQNKKDDLWARLPRHGQESRIRSHIDRYFEQYENQGQNVPWASIAGYALIGWLRENHPELLSNSK